MHRLSWYTEIKRNKSLLNNKDYLNYNLYWFFNDTE